MPIGSTMSALRCACSAVLLLLPLTQARAEFVPPPGVVCPDPDAASYDFNCSFVFYDRAQRELLQVYENLLATLSKQDATALRASQRAWLAFVKADVALVVGHYGEGGSLGRAIGADRSARHMRARIKELAQRLSGSDKW
jgi:uncharacterized protein YecT (DUF1311 family)